MACGKPKCVEKRAAIAAAKAQAKVQGVNTLQRPPRLVKSGPSVKLSPTPVRKSK